MRVFPFLRTIRARLTLWNVLALALTLLALGGVLRLSVERSLIVAIDGDLAVRARRHQDFWARGFPEMREHGRRREPNWDRMRPMPFMPPSGKPASVGDAPRPPDESASRWRTRILDVKGVPLFPPETAPLDRVALTQAARAGSVYTTIPFENEQMRVFSAPLRHEGQTVGIVQVGYFLTDVERGLRHLNRTLLTLIPVALAIAGLGGLFLTGRMLRPVREVTQAAARIGAEDLSQRLSVSGQDEFSELSATFNAMLGRLEHAFEQQRRFTADASHELRSPLTVIKANASLALSRENLTEAHRRDMENIHQAAGVMHRIVQDLLLLARSDAGQLELPLRPTPLCEVLEIAAACVQPHGETVIRNLAGDTNLIVQGDTGHLTRLFVNLLDNAVRHTPAEGCITLTAHTEGESVIVTVEDTGCGISPEHLPHICERFYRVDASRTRAQGGTGLGLAICQSIARAHGGSLTITSVLTKGTTVRVFLRRAES